MSLATASWFAFQLEPCFKVSYHSDTWRHSPLLNWYRFDCLDQSSFVLNPSYFVAMVAWACSLSRNAYCYRIEQNWEACGSDSSESQDCQTWYHACQDHLWPVCALQIDHTALFRLSRYHNEDPDQYCHFGRSSSWSWSLSDYQTTEKRSASAHRRASAD